MMATLFFLAFLFFVVLLLGGGVMANLYLRTQRVPERPRPRRQKRLVERPRSHTAQLHDVLFQRAL